MALGDLLEESLKQSQKKEKKLYCKNTSFDHFVTINWRGQEQKKQDYLGYH